MTSFPVVQTIHIIYSFELLKCSFKVLHFMKKIYRSNNHHKYSLNGQKVFQHGNKNKSNDQKNSFN